MLKLLIISLVFLSVFSYGQDIPMDVLKVANKKAAAIYLNDTEFENLDSVGIGLCADNWIEMAYGEAQIASNYIGIILGFSNVEDLQKFAYISMDNPESITVQQNGQIYYVDVCAEYRKKPVLPGQ
jgi:hypothetical protein